MEDVVALHAEIFALTNSAARQRVRSEANLRAALGRPQSYASYQGADVALQAAVLAHGLAEGQHFVDANKRTALVALLTFLAVNGYAVRASQDELAAWIISLFQGASIDALAGRIRAVLVVPGLSEL